uniref:Protein brambleberry-like n=1 Tax=Actinia tenebrosa TaxID=6105 RepID=A0A6P8I3R8_ACTTE
MSNNLNYYFHSYTMNRLHVILLLVLSCACSTHGWSLWPFSSDEANEGDSDNGAHLVRSPVPFEMTGAEERFLAEAKKYMGDLKPLDSCHQIVINRIKKSCSDINEEELGKLGVQLLNCQSLAENRPTYKCTDEMALAQCTSGMDVATWNSYHIISNRARSVCYATRQQQFRLKTEYTVNKLGKQTGQTELADLATQTVDKVTAGQGKLLEQQHKLQSSHEAAQRAMSSGLKSNIDALTQEKRLIEEGRKHLTDMTEKINRKLESATSEMAKQEAGRKQSHSEILLDLTDIKGKAQDVWNKIDEGTLQMMDFHQNSTEHYNNTLENLKKMNQTICYLLEAIDSMQSKLDNRITWLSDQFGGTDNKIATLVTCLMHAGYFFVATFSILFLQAPLFTRLVLLVMVPVNAWSEIKLGSSLSFSALSILLFVVFIGNGLYFYLKQRFGNNKQMKMNSLEYESPYAIGSPGSYKTTCDGSSCSFESFSSSLNSTILPKTPSRSLSAEVKRQLDMSSIPDLTSTPNRSLSSTLSVTGTPRRRCSATTKAGKTCKKVAANESHLCAT